MPTMYERGKYRYFGYFCSFECMRTYNLELNDSFVHKRFNLISQLNYALNGDTKCYFAPQKRTLLIFGGTKSIDEFRKDFFSAPHMELEFPLEDKEESILESVNDSGVISEYKPKPVVNEPIKLKRVKPLKNSQNTLEQTMGIFKSNYE
tara:strand:- start:21052 stop:21498 length:447 start_codon:yes stop_codon:yes gene_type:complete